MTRKNNHQLQQQVEDRLGKPPLLHPPHFRGRRLTPHLVVMVTQSSKPFTTAMTSIIWFGSIVSISFSFTNVYLSKGATTPSMDTINDEWTIPQLAATPEYNFSAFAVTSQSILLSLIHI